MIITNIPATGDKCVYVHRRKTDGIVFYVGYGSIARSKNRWNRTDHWKNVVAKHDYEIDYLAQNVSEEEAKRIEIEAIKFYRETVGDKLTNISDGGEGSSGLVGSKNPNFRGHCLFYNLDEKVYWVCSGAGQLEKDGFNPACVSLLKSGEIKSTSSTKIHKGGIKIRLQLFFSDEYDDLVNFIAEHDLLELELNDDPIYEHQRENSHNFGNCGERSKSFKGYCVGTSSNEIVIVSGNKMMHEHGFAPINLSSCIRGKRKTAYGFKWVRTLDLEPFKTTTLRPVNEFTAQLLK